METQACSMRRKQVSHCPFLHMSTIWRNHSQGNGISRQETAGKEDTVELDSSPTLWRAGADTRFWSGGPVEFWPQGGPEPKICSTLSENCMILKKSQGQRLPGPPEPPGSVRGRDRSQRPLLCALLKFPLIDSTCRVSGLFAHFDAE